MSEDKDLIFHVAEERYRRDGLESLKRQALQRYADKHPGAVQPTWIEVSRVNANEVWYRFRARFDSPAEQFPTIEGRDVDLKALNAEVLERFRVFEEKYGLVLDDVRLDLAWFPGQEEKLAAVDCVFRTRHRF